MTLHVLNDVANDVIIPSLKSEKIGILVNRIPGLCILISS